MDEVFIEAAEALQEHTRNMAIAHVTKQAIPTVDLRPSEYLTLTCVDCEDQLPDFRMRKGRIRCVKCVTAIEKRQKLLGP